MALPRIIHRLARGALVASVAAPAGTLHLVNTHLDASAGDHYRLQEIAQVRALADSLRRSGITLVGGDFNATPESRVVAHMTSGEWTDAWSGCGVGEGMTYPAQEPLKRIDYLFFSPGVGCDSAAVLPSHASDHRPVLLILNRGGGR
jgi:endonuclease/exonuclease/phosphatase family metal-dependent hydrolase